MTTTNESFVKVSYRPGQGFSKDIGKYRKADGQIAYKRFWFGHDQQRAIWLARQHVEYFDQHVKNDPRNNGLWTDSHVEFLKHRIRADDVGATTQYHYAQDLMKTLTHPVPGIVPAPSENPQLQPVPPAPTTPPPPPAMRLHDAIDKYVKWTDAKADRSASYKSRICETMDMVKRNHHDTDVKQIDRLWLDSFCQHWKNRPKHRKTGKRISTYTVKTVLQHGSQLFNWLSDNEDSTGFIEPKKMAKLFKYRAEEIEEIDQLTFDEVTKLYAAGTGPQRMYLLAGITCGMTQTELAAATADEFDLAANVWTHRRHKTRVPGSHWLCPELSAIITARLAETPANEKELAFLTRDGAELVTYRDGAKVSDAVRQAWDDLLNNAKDLKRRPSFKMCRKFLGQWMRDNYGEETPRS